MQQIILGSPQGTLLEVLAQFLIQPLQPSLQPGDVRRNVGLDRGGRLPTPILFGREHLHQLTPAGDQCAQRLRRLIGQRPQGRAHPLGKQGQDLGVEPIGLGQPAQGLGEVPHLAGIHRDSRQRRGAQRAQQGQLQAPGRLEHNVGDRLLLQMRDQGRNARLTVGHGPGLAGRMEGHIEARFGHVNAYKHFGLLHTGRSSCGNPVLPDAGSCGPGNCSGLGGGT